MTAAPSSIRRVLVVPAAGTGSRLGGNTPKVLAIVDGRAMIDHLLALYEPVVSCVVLVLSPASVDAVRAHCAARGAPALLFAEQRQPTGMLDALLSAVATVRSLGSSDVWVTWCDQIAIEPATIAELDRRCREHAAADLVLPTCARAAPYIHFERDERGAITAVRQRREGDAMPGVGESDCGLFGLRADVFLRDLPAYADAASPGAVTGERNFLPFIPWLARRGTVETFACHNAMESVGVNTPEELSAIEAHLRVRQTPIG